MEMRFEDRVHEAAMGYSALSAKESFQDTLEAFKAGVDWAIREYPVMKDIRENKVMVVDPNWMTKHEAEIRCNTVIECCDWMDKHLGRVVNAYSDNIAEVVLKMDLMQQLKEDMNLYGKL